MSINIIYLKIVCRQNEGSDCIIPPAFAHLIRITLSKLAGNGDLQCSLINQNFWKAWPRKFTSAASYAKRKDSVIYQINYLKNQL